MGLRETFRFRLLGEERISLGPGGPRAGKATGTYSTSTSSTTSEIRTPGLNTVSLRRVPPWYNPSLVSFAVQWWKTTRSQPARRSVMTWPAYAVPTILQGAQTGLNVMLSAIATESGSIVKPDSEKKLLCVKCGLRTKSYRQSRTPRTSSSLMATRSRLTINFSPRIAGPCITSVVNWISWNNAISWPKQTTHESAKQNAWLDTIYTLDRWWRARKPACAEQDRTSLRQGGSSWTTVPTAAVPAQKTGNQLCTLQLRFLWSTAALIFHPRPCWTAGKERCHPHQLQMQGRSN